MARQMLRPIMTFEQACHTSSKYVLACARVVSADTSLHVDRLRHFKSLVIKATVELWAILHYEEKWLHLMKDTLVWFRQQHVASGTYLPDWDTWEGTVEFIRHQPKKWRRAVNRAKQTASLRELWAAERQQHSGLFFRAILHLGAVVPPDLVDTASGGEICAKCGVVFQDLRAWSHHAFKRHGRVNPVRLLAQGSQCAVCLKHFKTNKFLCNHLEHSCSCRHALINAGAEQHPEPGTGSRKFDDGTSHLLPATQAQGPVRQWDFTPAVDEQNRPSEHILQLLESCFCHDAPLFQTYGELFSRIRAYFQSECLQKSRMRATAQHWDRTLQEALTSEEEFSVQWVAWHSRIAKFLVGADFIEWLGSDCTGVEQVVSTFKQAEILLPWVELDLCRIEAVTPASQVGIAVLPVRQETLPESDVLVFLHQHCKDNPSCLKPETLEARLLPGRLIYLSCHGLYVPVESSITFRSFKGLSKHLTAHRLFSDLLRGTLFLWTRRAPTCLYLPAISCATVEIIRRLAPFSLMLKEGHLLANFDCEGFSHVSP